MDRREGGRVQSGFYIGVLDIGGTKILAGLIDPAGELVARRRIETQAARGAGDIIARCAALLRELAQETRVPIKTLAGVGCSVPGPLDRDEGLVIFPPNLGWIDVPLVEMLQRALECNEFGSHVPVVIDDDAHCAALGEASRGAARGAVSAVYVTISTGIGAGVIINGDIYRGAHGFAGEVGHITIEPAGPLCACGNSGCFEALASGSAIAAQGQQAVLCGNQTTLANLNADPALLTAEQVVRAAEAGDAVATRIVKRAGTYLGIGLAAVATAFDPEMIVVGGGVARPNGMLLRRAREVFQARAIMPIGQRVRIVPAMLGDESGLWGAAALISSGR
jgi:glucokinase